MDLKKKLAIFVLTYLRVLAKIQLKKINPIVIGIGGASGKSSLSFIVASALASKYKVKQGKGKNSETGIPLDILDVNPGSYSPLDWIRILWKAKIAFWLNWKKYDIYICEMGIDGPNEPKNMSYLLKIIKPKIAALTNISYEHSVYFEGNEKQILDETAKQEMLLLKSLPADGFAVENIDDALIEANSQTLSAQKSTISASKETADFYATNLQTSLDKFSFNVMHLGEKYKFEISQMLPEHYVRSFLSAISIALHLSVPIADSINSISQNFKLPPGRMSVFEGIKDTTIVDSSYNNATLPPIMDILDLIQKVSGKRRKVAILGDMRELGNMSEKIHSEVAQKILETCDFAILIGPQMSEYVAPILKEKGFDYLSFQTFTDGREQILLNIKEKDVILVKGSQNTLFLERAVEMLLKNNSDKAKLCRRGAFWDKRRANTL